MKINKDNSQDKTLLNRHFNNSDELCEYIADLCGGVGLLAFSRGKDSVVAWLKMKRYFKKIVPYFMYPIPPKPMTFEEESLQYYEDYFDTHIIRIPHPSIYGFWIDGTYASPISDGVVIEAMKSQLIFDMKYEDAHHMIKNIMPELKNAYQASGVRSADSITRYSSIKTNGAVNHAKKTWFPIYDYKIEDMLRELRQAKIKLPKDYLWFGRTYDGIDYRFTSVLKEVSPVDYEQVIKAFPLVEADIARIKFREEYYENKKT